MNCPRTFSKIAAVILILTFGQSLARGAAPKEAPTIRRVWIGPKSSDVDDIWAVSRDGKFLVYRDSQSKLALYDLQAQRTRHLPVELSQQQGRVAFSWSRDGSHLAFNRQTRDGEQLQVVVLKTMRERVIARVDGSITPIGWSADSSQIAVAIERGTNVDIAWVSVERGSVRLIASVVDAFQNGRPFSAVLSPDSKQIAFTRVTHRRDRDIFTIREDGTQEKGVVEHPADDYPVS